MSGMKVIATAGASGYVGRDIFDELIKAGTFELRILTRNSEINSGAVQSFKQRGLSLHGVSYEDGAELVGVLKGVDVYRKPFCRIPELKQSWHESAQEYGIYYDKVLKIQGDPKSPNEVVKLWEAENKAKLKVTYHSMQELHDHLAVNSGDALGAVLRETALGRSRVPEPLSNDLFLD
ncbi:hypothetical protein BDV93DRAFT_589831 [Ceratobasidium sp. AG-I]|nr:hypothetical protein BDV93DRAFT_589831 [Ceratobasidium sp. AG-I]